VRHIDHRISLLAAPFVAEVSLYFALEAATEAYRKAKRALVVEAEQLGLVDLSQRVVRKDHSVFALAQVLVQSVWYPG
jgi:hypothetical protein